MKEFRTTTTIAAEPKRVWAVLIDTRAWPEWDPFCEKIDGSPRLGEKLKAYTKLSPGRGFGVRVTTLEPPHRMVWTGAMPLGLFKGERCYVLEAKGAGKTVFSMREQFSGPLLGLIGKSIPDMSEAFDAFAKGLKDRVERG